jgi:muramoyltetrapeptide carboxypeptidase LdcA involved in peptidoglycan recycling
MISKELHNNPGLRAKDINDAFSDSSIKGIITTIGGDDCVRILPFLDTEIIKNNHKLFMGYSDTTVLHTFFNQLGLVTYYGPSVLAGIAQTKYLPKEFKMHIETFLFGDIQDYSYSAYPSYCDGYPDWADPKTGGRINPLKKNEGWNWINGELKVNGRLFGGCIEALEFIKSTKYWPKDSFWENRILFFETSEEKPTPDQVKYMLRNYGTQGIFNKVSALLFGRPAFYNQQEKEKLNEIILDVVKNEFNEKNITIVTNMDFGHTDPQFILPIGMNTEVNFEQETIKILAN